ncbi:MAG: thioredoxin [candidate division Zixibacteria bacterium RBG_16_48_11]|nr:MAG: thioredoxin [candidate division Zixibacteria bacterium RBG_16_48_11]
MTSESQKKGSNRLKKEKSPYLLQHADNPVDWYPWGEEAFQKAKEENKPIFLSVGYSTCHWCHVMEHESFENPEIAAIMNQNFVSIKVDREERPDVDNIYMQTVVAMTGSGGWPLSAFLTPEGKPFFGGTYFPPDDGYGRPGLKALLLAIADAWKSKPEEINRTTAQIQSFLDRQVAATSPGEISEMLLKTSFQAMADNYDSVYGGFGQAPKFPMSHNLSFLLTYWYRYEEGHALEMVEKTLQKMAQGGMHDHLGGGFHRYSTDQYWLAPHFEKMLYDQAILSRTYLETYQITKNPFYAQVARGIFDYVLRDLTHPKGGFYSAEDADSEGEEGKFYVWKPREIKEILGERDGELFCKIYDVTETGNFEGEESILHLEKPLELLSKIHSRSESELRDFLLNSKAELFNAREKRIRPHRDDKLLTDWNGLMIASLAYGYQVLGEQKYLLAAENAADFILENLQKKGRLLKHYRQGAAPVLGYLDDYAFCIHGLIELYQASFEPRWLKEALRLTDEMIKLFLDEQNRGFFFTGADGEKLIVRTKEIYDGAIPSGNSVAMNDLLRLSRLTMNQEYSRLAEQSLKSFMGSVTRSTSSYSQMLIAADFYLGPTKEVVIVGEPNKGDIQQMIEKVRELYIPRKVVLKYTSDQQGTELRKMVPYLEGLVAKDGAATAYVCENFVCQLPTNDPLRFRNLLSNKQ